MTRPLRYRLAIWVDRLAIAAMLVSAGLLFQPWWRPGFQWGFIALLVATVAHIVTSHLPRGKS